MTPHPRVDALLARHGNTPEGRNAARQELTEAVLAGARREAAGAGRSIRCREGDHHRTITVGRGKPYVTGCANDGTTCICACHDEGTTP